MEHRELTNKLFMNTMMSDFFLIISCSFIFTIPALYRIHVSQFSINELIIGIDDWNRYARYAIDIKENGLLIKSIRDNYLIPAGFFYNYFVAFCFSLFGENPANVYVIQSILLGITVAVTYFIFRDLLKPITGLLFLILLIIFGFLDVYKYYSFRLLSENFALFTLTLFFFFFKKTLISKTHIFPFLSGLYLGISVLTRPNILPFSCILLTLILLLCLLNNAIFKNYWLIFLSYFLIISLLPLRNYLVTGNLSIMPVDGNFFDYMSRENIISLSDSPFQYFGYYIKKVIYCFGFLPILEPAYNYRPHWMVMWVGFSIYVIFCLLKPRQIKKFELSLLIFIFSYFIILILIAPVNVYGFRMQVPAMFIVLGVGLMGYERFFLIMWVKFRNLNNL